MEIIGRIEDIKRTRIIRGPIYPKLIVKRIDIGDEMIEVHIENPEMSVKDLKIGQVIRVSGHHGELYLFDRKISRFMGDKIIIVGEC